MGEMLKEMPKQPANQYSAFSQVEEKQKGKMEVVKDLEIKHKGRCLGCNMKAKKRKEAQDKKY
jgi:hypothetical protein